MGEEENKVRDKNLLVQAGASSPQERVSEDKKKYVVNPHLKADNVRLSGKDLGGDGEDGNRFYVNREYGNVKQEALDQKVGNDHLLVALN